MDEPVCWGGRIVEVADGGRCCTTSDQPILRNSSTVRRSPGASSSCERASPRSKSRRHLLVPDSKQSFESCLGWQASIEQTQEPAAVLVVAGVPRPSGFMSNCLRLAVGRCRTVSHVYSCIQVAISNTNFLCWGSTPFAATAGFRTEAAKFRDVCSSDLGRSQTAFVVHVSTMCMFPVEKLGCKNAHLET